MGIFDTLSKSLDGSLQRALLDKLPSTIEGTQGPEMLKAMISSTGELYRRTALIDPYLTISQGGGGYGFYKPKYSYISNRTLRLMSLRDPFIVGIFNTRINQVTAFSKPQINRHDTGFKVCPVDPNMEVLPGSQEEQEIKMLTDFVSHTGKVDANRHMPSKNNEGIEVGIDPLDFNDWLQLIVRDRLTYSYITIETIYDRAGRLYAFLPVSAECIYFANKQIDQKLIAQLSVVNRKAIVEGNAQADSTKQMEEFKEKLKNGEFEYVQMIDDRVVSGFTRKDMIFKIATPQNFIDSAGYPVPELEMAIDTITTHLQANSHNKQMFVNGKASRGILHIQGSINPQTLQQFRAQFHAQIIGHQNSWQTPVLAGEYPIQWVPLDASNKDMEFSMYNDHLLRTLCAIFVISPLEIGFDYLTRGSMQKSMSESDNLWKLQDSHDRGLRPLLSFIESLINEDIFTRLDPQLAKKYKFCFVGLDAESKMEEAQRQTIEAQLHASLNDLRKEVQKDPVLCGDFPLNAAYASLLFRTHTLGEIRAKLLGATDESYKNDINDERFNYIADPFYFQNMQMKMNMPMPGAVGPDGQPISGIEQKISDYIQKHPELMEKSFKDYIEKTNSSTSITKRYDAIQEAQMKSYKDVEKMMMDELLTALKDDVVKPDEKK